MKQRLVGAIVLGCLAIIFLPILLDGEGVAPPEMNTTIPLAPPFPEPLEVEPVRPEISRDSDAITTAPAREPIGQDVAADREQGGPAAPVAEDRPALDAEGLPQAWSIRLGLFGERANADALMNRLLNQQYRAYTEPVRTAQGELTAVFVGPVMTRSQADALRAELATNFDLNGLIVDFEINDAE